MAHALHCPGCRSELPADPVQAATFMPCPRCGLAVRAIAFPALLRSPPTPTAHESAGDGESSCFFHTGRRARSSCGHCGRFVCALCEVTVGPRILCPTCLTSGRESGENPALVTSRPRWDSRCVLLAAVPLVFWPITLITAPATLVLAIRHRNTPGSLVNAGRGPLWAAVALALVELAGWVSLAVAGSGDAFQ